MTASRRIAPKLLLLLIGLAVLLALLPTSSSVQAQTPANQSATGRPVVLASAEGAGILFADTEGIADGNGLPFDTDDTYATFTWSYQWIRVAGNSETNVGANSASYQPVEADVGNKIKVKVSFRDGDNFPETVTSLPFGPVAELARPSAPPSKLVSNTGQSASATANITQRYAQGFRLGDHGQGYEISSVSIELAAVPSSLTVSLWSGGVEGGFKANTANKLFEFANPSSFAVGLNKFTAPAGAFAYQNVNYFIVLSGFGTSLDINETTSDNEDAGGETGAVIYNNAAVRALSDTGTWVISTSRASVLRLAVEGSKRASGILASNYAQDPGDSLAQEIISLGDKIGFGFELGAADRYLIRGVSWNMDDTTSSGSGFTNPWDLRSGSRTGAVQFSLVNTRKAAGLPVWTAPQGATVTGGTGGQEYVFDWPISADEGTNPRRDAILTRVAGADSDGVDSPAAAGVSLTGAKGDVALPDPYMAVLGEPLDAMVQNLGQTNNGYRSVDGTNKVLSQEFTTGSNEFGYRVQGIGVNIEGSGSNFPDGPTSVSVAVHASLSGRPRAKLFDLVSPTEYAAGHSFFEAPPGTNLAPNTSYVLVWSHLGGASHRLRKTASNNEDSGALTGASIANAFYRGADLGIQSLSEDSGGNALEIAVYTEVNTETVVYITEPPPPPPPPPFVPGVSGDAILRCSIPPADYCPTYDDVPAEHTFLSTTMTVGRSQITTLGTVLTIIGYSADTGTLASNEFTYRGTTYSIITLARGQTPFGMITLDTLNLTISPEFPSTFHPELALELDGRRFLLTEANRFTEAMTWNNHGLTWTENDSVAVRLTEPPLPNAYGYRTIWTALMTAEVNTAGTFTGYYNGTSLGEITNDLIVDGRDETVTIGTVDQPQYPWTGYQIEQLTQNNSKIILAFNGTVYPTEQEVSGWTLTLGGGVALPFADAALTLNTVPSSWTFNHDPNWTDGDQVVVSIQTDELQNRIGQVNFKSRRSTRVDQDTEEIVYGKTHFIYDRSNGGKFGPRNRWELLRLQVTTDKTGDTDPVWIAATFRAPDAYTGYQGWWEGQFDDFHTLFLRWIYHVDGVGKGEATYTFPLKAAAEEGGIRRSSSGRDITFTWVRTYKEFQRRHLDLANHSDFSAHMLAPPKPATARAGGEGGDEFSLSGYYEPVTVTSVDFTSNPGSDQVYGPWSTIQVTVTFSEDVTVGYVGSKRDAAELDLEMDGQTRTAHYASTEGNRVKFEYTVLAGDEATFALRLRPNSLRLSRDKPSEHGSIRDSEGRDAVLDHYGLASTAHRVDAVSPEFASALVSTDGAQVAVTFDESIKSPAILRWFGVQTSLLQSLTLDVWVDGELAARSDAALSGDTVTLTMAEPITQGQTVTVSYDNLFIETGESIFEDLHGNKLATFTEQPVTNGSALADVERPDGGLALSRTDLEIDEGESGTYTVALASQPASDVTVEISQRPPGRATVSPASLTFTADNWNTPQTVTITSTEDANYVDRWLLLRHVATGDNYGASAAAWLLLRDGYNLVTATPNTGATGSPTISGTPQVGQTLTLDTSEIADADGLTHASYTYLYQWIRNNAEIAGETESTYTLVSADQGQTIKVKVSFTDDANNAESRISAATVAVAPRPNDSPTGAPTISGTPQVRRTLTVDTSEIADADGLETAVFRYQWFATIGLATVEFHGETSSTYTLGPLSEGLAIKVKVSFTDDRGHSETLTSAATETVIAADPNSEPTGLPAITGPPQVGQTLTADTSAIADEDGLTNVTFEYQWIAGGSDIDGATGSSYLLTSSDQGQTIQVRVNFTDDADNQESLTSAETLAVAAKPNTAATGEPTISGTPQVEQTLTADTSAISDGDGLSNVSYQYQWLRDGADIAGQTNSTYRLVSADQDKTIQVRVTFRDDADNAESLTSMATTAVAARPTPAVLLTASFANVPADHNGGNFTFDLNFSENVNAGYARIRDDAFTVSGGAIASASRKTQGSNQGWTVEVDPEGNGSVSITLPETTDCDASGAICTDDSRKLSQSTSATVAGPPAIAISDATVQEAEGAVLVFTATLSHASSRTVTVDYATSDGTAVAGSDYTAASGTLTFNAGDTSQTVQVTVLTDSEDESQETLTLTLSNPSQATLDDATGTGAIENGESSSGTQEDPPAEDPPAVLLTASFGNMPATHNGSAFTFDLTFSEEFGISYVTLRDDALSVTDGEVTSARRLTQGSNIGWTITVTPGSAADVTIVLPVTTDCDADGAVCTADGRKLSNRLEFTVSGPSG